MTSENNPDNSQDHNHIKAAALAGGGLFLASGAAMVASAPGAVVAAATTAGVAAVGAAIAGARSLRNRDNQDEEGQ